MNGGGGEGFLKVNEGGAKDFLRQKQKSRTKYFLIQLLGPNCQLVELSKVVALFHNMYR